MKKRKRSALKGSYNKSRKMVARAQELFENVQEYLSTAAETFEDESFGERVDALLEAMNPIINGDSFTSGTFAHVTDYLENEGAEFVNSVQEEDEEEEDSDF